MQSIRNLWNTWSGKVFLLAIPIYLFITVNDNWMRDNGTGWQQIHRSDVKGYYGYLLSTFIRGDLGHEQPDGDYIHETPDGTLNKYFIGTSIMMAPWFGTGHLVAAVVGEEQDGLSWPYLILVNLGALFYAFLGLFFFRKLLYDSEIGDALIAWLLLALLFATLVLQYTSIQPGWTHIYSFCCAILFYHSANRFVAQHKTKYLFIGAVLFALIVLIRPVNGLLLLGIPVILGPQLKAFVAGLKNQAPNLFAASCLGTAIVLIQPLFWYLQTGHFVEWSYRSEGFHWDRPAFLQVFFSFRRGLFIYTPVLLLFLAGLGVLLFRQRHRALWALLYFFANSYVISAWWIWDYGGGFGQRPFIEHYPILFFVIALALQEIGPKIRRLSFAFIACCSVFTMLQWVQYQREIIQHEYMTFDKYAHVFLHLNQWYEFNLGGVEQIPPHHPNGMQLIYSGGTAIPANEKPWELGMVSKKDFAHSPPFVCELNAKIEFSTSLTVSTDLAPVGRALFLKASVQRYEPYIDATHGALVVLSIEGPNGEKKYYDSHRLDAMRRAHAKTWEEQRIAFEIPPMEQGDVLSFYIWNQAKKTFYLDDFSAELYVVNDY